MVRMNICPPEFPHIWFPALNPDCKICHNFDPQKYGRRIEFNDEFLESAKNLCLACNVLHNVVKSFVHDLHYWPSVTLESSVQDIGVENETRAMIIDIQRTRWSWNDGEKTPSWDNITGVMKLQVYVLPDEPSIWPAILPAPEPALDSTSDLAMSRVKSWVETCKMHHRICQSFSPTILPPRVLHVGSEKSYPRLVWGGSIKADYIALSWRWGTELPSLRTLAKNLGSHQLGIAPSRLPPLFRDAVTVCRKLGCKFLWIDALCIIQDNSDDWEDQAGRMTEVYSNAWITIAADSCKDSTQRLNIPEVVEGVGQLRNLRRSAPAIPCPGPHSTHSAIRFRVRDHADKEGYHGSDYLPASSVGSRGWCFQEALLSRRILHFGYSELSFQCLEAEMCECTPGCIERKYSMDSMQQNRLELRNVSEDKLDSKLWTGIVEEYCERDLTFQKDRLTAIGGIAKFMEARISGSPDRSLTTTALVSSSYLAGLWRSQLGEQLVWYAKPPATKINPLDRHSRGICIRQEQAIAPSWSWASVTGAVGFSNGGKLDVIGGNCSALDRNPYGPCTGYVVLQAKLQFGLSPYRISTDGRPYINRYSSRCGYWYHGKPMLVDGNRGSWERLLFLDDWNGYDKFFKPEGKYEHDSLVVLVDKDNPSLLLLLCKVPESHPGPSDVPKDLPRYQRVGFLDQRGGYGAASPVTETQTIALI